MGINAVGNRTQKLNFIYRNTVELVEFSKKFLENNETLKGSDKGAQIELFPGFNDFHGPAPSIVKFLNMGEIVDYVVDNIIHLKNVRGVPFSEIAIVYASKYFSSPTPSEMPSAFMEALDYRGIFCTWVSEDVRAKKSYDITTNTVTLSSIHSVKGLDYSCLFFVGLDFMESGEWTEGEIERLNYVAITRARDQLYIPYIQKTPLIEKLSDCL